MLKEHKWRERERLLNEVCVEGGGSALPLILVLEVAAGNIRRRSAAHRLSTH
jgi:hypothetical protein